MTIIRITKEFAFEMAHILWNYDGPCKNIHGHSYKLLVTVSGKPITESGPKKGMVMDFSDLKKVIKEQIIDVFDHAFVYGNDYSEEGKKIVDGYNGKKIELNSPATSENLLIEFADRIKSKLPANVKLHSLRLNETASCFAEWYADDN